MRKVVDVIIILIIVAMTSIIIPYSRATTDTESGEESTVNIEMNLTPSTVQVDEGTKTVELTLSLGAFQGIAEGSVLAYQGNITFDTSVFESVEANKINEDWTAKIASNIIQGDTDNAKPNTNIAKIVCTLKDGLPAGTTGKITISNLTISDGTDATDHINYTKTSTITIGSTSQGTGESQGDEQVGTGEEGTELQLEETTQQGNSVTQSSSSSADATTASSTIPKAGTQDFIKIAILVILAMALFSLIRYKMIKLK